MQIVTVGFWLVVCDSTWRHKLARARVLAGISKVSFAWECIVTGKCGCFGHNINMAKLNNPWKDAKLRSLVIGFVSIEDR